MDREIMKKVCLAVSIFVLFAVATASDASKEVEKMQSFTLLSTLEPHQGTVMSVAFDPWENYLASAGSDGTIIFWEVISGKLLNKVSAHTGTVYSVKLTPDGKYVVSCGGDDTIKISSRQTGEILKTLPGDSEGVECIAISPSGKYLVSEAGRGKFRLWELPEGKLVGIIGSHKSEVTSLAFSPANEMLASGSVDGTIVLWEMSGGKLLKTKTLKEHPSTVFSLAFDQSGSYLASGSWDKSIKIWEMPSGELVKTLNGHTGGILSVAFSPVGHYVASGSVDGDVKLWKAETGQCLKSLPGHKDAVISVAFGSSGLILASGSRDGTVKLWGSEELSSVKWKEVGKPRLPPKLLSDYSFQPESRIVKAGGEISLSLELTNGGKGEAYRVKAKTESSEPMFNNKVIYFGKLDIGETLTKLLTFLTPVTESGVADLRIEFSEYNDYFPEEIMTKLRVEELPRPAFAYSQHVIDDGSGNSVGNGDGCIQKGEAIDLLLTVRNVGTGVAKDVTAEIKSEIEEGVEMPYSKAEIGDLSPDEYKRVRLTAVIKRTAPGTEWPLQLSIRERSFDIAFKDKIVLPLNIPVPGEAVVPMDETVVALEDLVLRSGASEDAPVRYVGIKKDAQLHAVGEKTISEKNVWYQIDAEKKGEEERVGWVNSKLVKKLRDIATPKPPPPIVIREPLKGPPVIAIFMPKDNEETFLEQAALEGMVIDYEGVERIEFKVNDERLTEEGKGIEIRPRVKKGIMEPRFSKKINLKVGRNKITVIAYNTSNLRSEKNVLVSRIKKKGKVWAAVIGINGYPNVRKLKYAVNDAQAFYSYLVENLGITEDHIYLLLEEKATLWNIKTTLGTKLKGKAGKEDTVIIYYSGHGAPEPDKESPDGDGLEKYILPFDVEPENLYASALPMREISNIFARISSERLVFIADTCYSGASGGRTIPTVAAKAVISDNFLNRISQGKGRIILTASEAAQVSIEKDSLDHGVFTYYLLEGLKGRADFDHDGLISVSEAYKYVSEKVPEATGQNQHPVKKGEEIGQIIIGKVK